MNNEYHEAPWTCKYCGAPSWVDPSDQSPPINYCWKSDHGSYGEYKELYEAD